MVQVDKMVGRMRCRTGQCTQFGYGATTTPGILTCMPCEKIVLLVVRLIAPTVRPWKDPSNTAHRSDVAMPMSWMPCEPHSSTEETNLAKIATACVRVAPWYNASAHTVMAQKACEACQQQLEQYLIQYASA